jgi:tryptophanyl-tRNA synthetase
MKKQLAADINAFCAPLRERVRELTADEAGLEKVVRMGAEKASDSAARTLREVRRIIGFKP